MLVEKGKEQILAMPEFAPPPEKSPAPMAAVTGNPSTAAAPRRGGGGGGATVVGYAAMQYRSGAIYSSTGRDVLLLPRTPQNLQWFNQRVETGRVPMDEPLGPSRDLVLQRSGRVTQGYGAGYFEFKDVPPGDYVAFFEVPDWQRFPGDAPPKSYTWFPQAKVTVRPGETRVTSEQLVVPAK
jgi:hypothetical protein